MDPTTISALAAGMVAVLAPYLAKAGEEFAKEVGKAASDKLGALCQMVKARLQAHPAGAKALAEVAAKPEDEAARSALRLELEKQMEADPAWAGTLRQLLDEVAQDKQGATFLTQVYGGKVGKIINIDRTKKVQIE
jgi:hypothetical protein